MKIGIIVYSYTNNTLTIANQLNKSLIEGGYDSEVQTIRAVNEDPNNTKIVLTQSPILNHYDKVVFATCVRGFDCAPIFKEYLSNIDSLDGIMCAGFVSQYFPWDALGGTQALKRMKNLVESKKGLFHTLKSIHVKSKQKDRQIEELIHSCIRWLE